MGYLDLTGVDLIKLVQEAYNLSDPVGMGFLHFVPGPLSDEEAKAILLAERERSQGSCVFHLDYVKGRCCKFGVWVDSATGKLYTQDSWYDHTPEQLTTLLGNVGILEPKAFDKE